MTRNWKLVALLAVVLATISIEVYSLTGGPLNGVVLDKETNEPIAGAIVIARWHGNWTKIFGESSSACYHVETTRTDEGGRYHIPLWVRAPKIEDLRFSSAGNDVSVFKPGYVDESNGSSGTIYLTKFAGNNDEYFATVLDYRPWLCSAAAESSSHAYRLFKAAAADAKARAQTPSQLSRASSLEHLARESLVDTSKPTTYRGDTLVNVDPKDRLGPFE